MKSSVFSFHKRIHSRHFKTSFLMLFLLSHLLLASGLLFWSNSFYTTAREKADFRLSSLMHTLEQTLSTAKDNALFTGSLPSVNSALLSPSATTDHLSAISKDLDPFVPLMAYDSLTLYFKQSALFYDTKAGLYTADHFYNPALLSRFEQREKDEYWEFGYPYRYFYDNAISHHVLTYVHALPIYGTEKYGFLAVNIPLSVFRQLLQQYDTEYGEIMLFSFNNHLIWNTTDSSMSNKEIPLSDTHAVSPQIRIQSDLFPFLQAEIYFPRNFVQNHLLSYAPILLPFYLLFLLLLFTGSYFYTNYHLNKLDSFLQKLGMSGFRSPTSPLSAASLKSVDHSFLPSKTKISSFSYLSAPIADEFQMLQEAADHFQTQIDNIHKTVAASKPLLKERLLTNILYHHIDVNQIPPEYAEYDICFPYPYFCVVLMAIEEIGSVPTATIKEEIKLVAKENATQLLSSLGKVYSIYSEKENILFLLNTSEQMELRDRLTPIATALRKGMKESLGFHLLFSIAICDSENPVPYYAWTKARKNMIYTYGSADSFLIFGKQENHTTALMPSAIFPITQALIDSDKKRLAQALEQFYSQILPPDTPAAIARKTLLLAATAVFSTLLEMDILFSVDEMNQIFRKLTQANDLNRLKELFSAYLDGLIATENKVSDEAQEYIRQTVTYLQQHFRQPITVPQIAENVNISPIYLNKLFKLSTGKTLSEYLNYYRAEQSKIMLLTTDMTVNDISKALGYNDVRSYIRFFKKFYDVTPNHFRKSIEE